MLVFTTKTRSFIERAILEFGTPANVLVWLEWSAAHPEVRRGPDDPYDDGNGPMPDDLNDAIVGSVQRQFDHLMHRIKRSDVTADEVANLSNDAAVLYSIGCSVKQSDVGWWR
jgi:hypothetical protein